MRTIWLVLQTVVLSIAAVAQSTMIVQTAVAPHYPPIAVAERAAETIKVSVKVASSGHVLSATATSGTNIYLKRESERAAMRWVFDISSAKEGRVELTFVYALLDEENDEAEEVVFQHPLTVIVHKHLPKTSGPLP